MIRSHIVSLARGNFLRQSRLGTAAVVVGASLLAAGCHNYTEAPLCTDENAAVPEGLTGTYSVTTQNQDFETRTQKFTVEDPESGFVSLLDENGDSQEARLCRVEGKYLVESEKPKVKGYEAQRLHVTGLGLVQTPVFYDRSELEEAGIPTQVITVPESVEAVVGPQWARTIESAVGSAVAAFSDTKGLFVQNADVPAEKLARHAKEGPIGIILKRK